MTTTGPPDGNPREDELLSRLYQHLTEQQATRFGAGYDLEAGLDRYRTWLQDHAAQDHPRLQASPARTVKAQQASGPRTGAASTARAPGETETLIAGPAGPRPAAAPTGNPGPGPDADEAVTALYAAHYQPLIRLATLLVHDTATAEEIVQDSFVALHAGMHRLRDNEKALAYLRAAVVNRSRTVLRHRVIADKHSPLPGLDTPAAEPELSDLIERSAVVSALRALPVRQREAVVLRFYAGLSEAQIATIMGISRGAVKSHTSRAMSSIRNQLAQNE